MTTIRKIVTSKIDGSNADNNDIDEIRPFGETAFYVDTNGPIDKLVLSIHDGVRTHQKSKVVGPGVLYGSNADSGDGGGYDTIKLIPDAALGSDQYIVVDPTGGEPGHIHLRAGGTQDASGADLYLGGELTNVRVSDTADTVRVRTSIVSEGEITYDWIFDNNGRLTFPQGGAIESHGMGWTGFTNAGNGAPLSIAYKDGSTSLSEILLIGGPTEGTVSIYTQDTEEGTSHQWTFDEAGETVLPGSVAINSARINITAVVSAAGTIISVPLNAAGDTVDYTGGASLIEVPKNADTDQVQAGWIITFNGGAQRTVSDKIDGGSYYAITFNEANPGGTLYPLTIQSSDYVIPVTGKIDLVPDSSTPNTKLSFDANGILQFSSGAIIDPADSNLEVRGINNFNVEAGGVVNIYTATDSVTPHQWQFDDNGDLTFPNNVKITLGGAIDQNAINFSVPDSMDSNTRYEWSFDASYGIPYLRFPNGTLQSTALKAETIPQVGYQLTFATDIYDNTTGGVLTPYQTSVSLESNAQVRALFQVEAFATSTTARAYNHPTNPGEIILEVASVTGAPIAPNTAVWAIVNGTPTSIGDIDSQQDPTTWLLIGAPLQAEVVIGTEFEFYGGGFVSYSPTQTIVLEWADGTETEVVEGITNNPYGVNIALFTAEDQTTLNYPMILTTADYAPAEFSHVIDVDNNFKITSKANDFILFSDQGPLVIRNATSEFIFEGNTLTVPGTISLEGTGQINSAQGRVTFGDAENTVAVVSDQIPVKIQINDALDDPDQVWLFGTNGVLTLPGEGVIRSNDDTLVLQSYDTTFNVGKGIRIGSNGHVYFELGDDPAYFQIEEAEGDAQLVARTNLTIMASGGSTIKQWTFNTDGTVTFPDSTVQTSAWTKRIVAVPTSSLGTTGDLEGDLAFNATYMYYCTQDFAGTVINMTSISSSGSSTSYILMYTSNSGWTSDDLTGYTVTGPSGYTGTVTGPSQDQGGNLWRIPVSPNVTQAMGTYSFTSPTGGNIWKRIAWSGDTW